MRLDNALKSVCNMPEGIELNVYLTNSDGRGITLWLDDPGILNVRYHTPGKRHYPFTVDFDKNWIQMVIDKLNVPSDSEGWVIDNETFSQLRCIISTLRDVYNKWEAWNEK